MKSFIDIFSRLLETSSVIADPVYIIGCGHSGTSLLLAIIGSHKNVYAIPRESRVGFKKNAAKARRCIDEFNRSTIAHGKKRWVEKTPRHIYRVDDLKILTPGAKFLLIIRDGRDVACSMNRRYKDFRQATQRWKEDNIAGQKHWQDPGVHVLKYEDIIEDFDGTIRGVFGFIGEPYFESVRDFHLEPRRYYSDVIKKPKVINESGHNQYRNWQINQPLFDARGRWKTMMAEDQKHVFKEVAGDMLIEYGYAIDYEW